MLYPVELTGRRPACAHLPHFARFGKSFGPMLRLSSQNSIQSPTAPWIGVLVKTGSTKEIISLSTGVW